MKKQLLLILMTLLPMVANADESGTCGTNLTWTYYESTHSLEITGSGDMYNYENEQMGPGYYGTTPWKIYCNDILNVTLPEGLTSIGEGAFFNCSRLTSLNIPNTVTFIGDWAFYRCKSMTSMTIPNSVTSIGNGAFSGCSSLTSVIIPNSVTSISNEAFKSCVSLTSMVIPNSVTSIGGDAFQYCTSLVSVTIPNSVTYIGSFAFEECSNLTSVTIPNSVMAIENYTFRNCSSLVSVIIGNSVTSIGEQAFQNCSSLASVTIGKSVTSIGDRAFYGCNSLSAVHIIDLEAWCKISFYDNYNSLSYYSIYSISNPLCYAHHLFLNGVEIKDLVIPNSVTSISRGAFYGCSGITSVTIPNSITSIPYCAFYGCSGLISVTIPNSVTSIGEKAFDGCSNISSVYIFDLSAWCRIKYGNNTYPLIPSNHHLYLNGVEIEQLIIPSDINNLQNFTFYGFSYLTSIIIPNNVTSIGEQVFANCSSLTSVSLPDNLVMIRKQTFKNCSNLQKLDIPASVGYIYQEAFSGCNSLSEIIARPETPPFIYDDTFSNYNCTLKVPDAGKEAYAAHETWSKFGTIQTISGEDIEKNKCGTPTISYANGKLTFGCETEGVEYRSTITDTDISSYTTAEVQLTATYNISVYATKSGYDNSDVATATLCWIDKEPVIAVTNVSQVPAKAILIQNDGGLLTVQGLDDGTEVSVYGVNGTEAGTAVSRNGQAQVNTHLSPGSVAIVKVGEKSVKVVIK